MFQHEDKWFDDAKIRPFELTRRAIRNYKNNECEVMVVTGMPEGIGKSNYLNHALADTLGFLDCKDWEKLKFMKIHCADRLAQFPEASIWEANYDKVLDYTKYLPEDVVNMCMGMMDRGERVPMWHWDDGGTHLNSMEYNDPFVKAFMEFLPLARTICGLVVISTPVEEWVLKKLHTATGVIHAPVIKLSSDEHFWRPRRCKPYRRIRNAAFNRGFPQYQWQDDFPAITPDSFYKQYKPVRDYYARIAITKMKVSLEKRSKHGKNVIDDSMVLTEIGESIEKTEEVVPEFQEMVNQKVVVLKR